MQARTENADKSLELFRRRCRQKGLSVTPQRVAIYEALSRSKEHPSAEAVYDRVKERFADIALDTVYRTLTTFSEIGLLDVVEGYGEAKRYDPDVGPHHHFRCKRCNVIVDFHERRFDKLEIPAAIKEKYAVSGIKVVVEGLCDKCRRKAG